MRKKWRGKGRKNSNWKIENSGGLKLCPGPSTPARKKRGPPVGKTEKEEDKAVTKMDARCYGQG